MEANEVVESAHHVERCSESNECQLQDVGIIVQEVLEAEGFAPALQEEHGHSELLVVPAPMQEQLSVLHAPQLPVVMASYLQPEVILAKGHGVWPEDCPSLQIGRLGEEGRRVSQCKDISIQVQDLLEGRVQQDEGREAVAGDAPAPGQVPNVSQQHLTSPVAQRQHCLRGGAQQRGVAVVPELHGQPAARAAQRGHSQQRVQRIVRGCPTQVM
mmetsp:Transcript_15229/g.43581  ORF Transcript_15229/g.43581 Transcript_15229/m.43581 type:complete len:214 (+) Transcript_15229:497-1138(+)